MTHHQKIKEKLLQHDILRISLKPDSLKKLPEIVLNELYELLPNSEKEVLLSQTSKRTRSHKITEHKPTYNSAYFEAACQLYIKYLEFEIKQPDSAHDSPLSSSSHHSNLSPSHTGSTAAGASTTQAQPNLLNSKKSKASLLSDSQTMDPPPNKIAKRQETKFSPIRHRINSQGPSKSISSGSQNLNLTPSKNSNKGSGTQTPSLAGSHHQSGSKSVSSQLSQFSTPNQPISQNPNLNANPSSGIGASGAGLGSGPSSGPGPNTASNSTFLQNPAASRILNSSNHQQQSSSGVSTASKLSALSPSTSVHSHHVHNFLNLNQNHHLHHHNHTSSNATRLHNFRINLQSHANIQNANHGVEPSGSAIQPSISNPTRPIIQKYGNNLSQRPRTLASKRQKLTSTAVQKISSPSCSSNSKASSSSNLVKIQDDSQVKIENTLTHHKPSSDQKQTSSSLNTTPATTTPVTPTTMPTSALTPALIPSSAPHLESSPAPASSSSSTSSKSTTVFINPNPPKNSAANKIQKYFPKHNKSSSEPNKFESPLAVNSSNSTNLQNIQHIRQSSSNSSSSSNSFTHQHNVLGNETNNHNNSLTTHRTMRSKKSGKSQNYIPVENNSIFLRKFGNHQHLPTNLVGNVEDCLHNSNNMYFKRHMVKSIPVMDICLLGWLILG